MKALETGHRITICPYCKSKLEIEPNDISPLSVVATSLGFKGSFMCPACNNKAYLIKISDHYM